MRLIKEINSEEKVGKEGYQHTWLVGLTDINKYPFKKYPVKKGRKKGRSGRYCLVVMQHKDGKYLEVCVAFYSNKKTALNHMNQMYEFLTLNYTIPPYCIKTDEKYKGGHRGLETWSQLVLNHQLN